MRGSVGICKRSDQKVGSTSFTSSFFAHYGFSVVFTSWTRTLDLIEKALASAGIIFQRIDGGKSLRNRRHAIQSFRNNPSCTVLLASIGSAGVG
jgi:superfamily II DNA/RNA helicase